MVKYVLKRLALMLLVFFIIMTMCFVFIRMLPIELPQDPKQREVMENRLVALGIFEVDRTGAKVQAKISKQYFAFMKNLFTKFDLGTSWWIDYMEDAGTVILTRLPPTITVNLYSMLLSVPIGIGLGIYAALKKNKWQDHVISTLVIVFVSVPSYVYAPIVQHIFATELGWFPFIVSSLGDAGGSYFSPIMLQSQILPILSLSFGTIAGLTRFTRAELTETLTSEYMLLARAKGLTKAQCTVRHALKNAMVPIFPTILSMFIGILGGSMVIETIFAIPGVGSLYVRSITQRDYDVFLADSMFYTLVSLLATLVMDLSYGIIDPRIRMGAKK